MKKAVLLMLAAGCWISSYATDARVIAMGRHDNFFMDEVSIFRNPANINIYPNMVYGSYGIYRPGPGDTVYTNPADPFFGAIVSYSLNRDSTNRNQYPMVSLGAVFNRHDEMLDYLTPHSDKYIGNDSNTFKSPAGKIDLLGGYVLQNGGMIGIGAYLAFQSMITEDIVDYETSVYKLNLGINWPIAKSANLEVSLNGGILRAKGDDAGDTTRSIIIANNDWFIKGDLRFFSALSMLKGDFVPHISAQRMHLYHGNTYLNDVAAGVGININIDKGFFWAGLEGLYKDYTFGLTSSIDSAKTSIGGRVSFGIERSIWWDWFVIRVGGQKALLHTTKEVGAVTRGRWDENNPADGSDNDLVGLGFGVNVENRLRVDFVASENVPYTFTNLISGGTQHYLFTRVSATYSF